MCTLFTIHITLSLFTYLLILFFRIASGFSSKEYTSQYVCALFTIRFHFPFHFSHLSQSCPSQSQPDFHLWSECTSQYVCALLTFYLLGDHRPTIYINWRFAWLQIEKFPFFMTLVANKPQFLCTIRPRNFFAQSGAEIYTDCILLLACNFLSHISYMTAYEPLPQNFFINGKVLQFFSLFVLYTWTVPW